MIAFGLTPAEFQQRHLEQQPLLAKRALREPFPWSELDTALHQIEPTAPVFQLFNAGPVGEERYTDLIVELGAPRRRLNQRRFYAELRGGATLVINGFENHSARGLRLCAELGRFTGWRTVGNAYLSVGGRGTFGQHWDTHDVFAIQLIGRKRWLVYPPTFPLPLGMHRSDGSGHACPATPVLDCVLEARDLLYVPRGWWHQAIPFDEPSLHLSVGTYGPTVHDYLTWACGAHLPAALAARRSLTSDAAPQRNRGGAASLPRSRARRRDARRVRTRGRKLGAAAVHLRHGALVVERCSGLDARHPRELDHAPTDR